MGTRGFMGFVVDGVEKITYNHSDSYPDGLGADVLGWLRGAAQDPDRLKSAAAALRVVPPASKPSTEDVERLRRYANTRVGTKDLDDWYVLLRETQGNPARILDAGVIVDSSDFPSDSLFAEYGYVVDADARVFEAYVGFVKQPHKDGRFWRDEPRDGYYPVRLVQSWPFAELPSDDGFCAAFEQAEDLT